MSIFKETFQDFVYNQLKIREAAINQKSGRLLGAPKVEGKNLKNSKDIFLQTGAFYTSTTSKQCTIRMSSGANLKSENDLLDNNDLKKENLYEEGLAIRYMLEGGIPAKDVDFKGYNKSDVKKTPEIKVIPRGRGTRQFTKGKGSDYGSAYGDPYIRSDAKDGYGIVPMPGIIDAEIRTKTAYGSLRDAKINFVCHNRRQLDILETLYMRPGMPILLEWGWSPYINNDGKIDNYFPYLWEWFNKDQTINEINNIIHQRIKISGGNYDGFVGFVKNFEIISRPDGGFDCTTELAAMGEVLEGIKGKSDGFTIKKDLEDVEVDNLEFYLKALRDFSETRGGLINSPLNVDIQLTKNIIGIQNNIIPLLTNKSLNSNDESFFEQTLEGVQKEDETLFENINVRKKYFDEVGNIEKILDKYLLYKGEVLTTLGNEAYTGEIDFFTKSSSHYIKWELLALILNSLVIDTYQEGAKKPSPLTEVRWVDEVTPSTGPKQPLQYSKYKFKNDQFVTFTRSKEGGNKEVTSNFSDLLDMSIDPTICLLPHQLLSLKIDKTDEANEDLVFDVNKLPSNRNIKDIFINLDYLIKLYERTRYKNEEINEDFNLFTYLQTIWEKDINNACAGTHEFIIHTEKIRGNVIRIVDMQRSSLTPDKLYEFKTHGDESIVRDFNYNTTIDSKLSSTISIAAQSPSSISDLDAISFAAFNRNIEYRFFKEKIIENSKIEENRSRKEKKYNQDLQNIQTQLGYLYDYKIDLLKGNFTDNEGNIDPKLLNVATARKYVKSLESKIISLKSRYSKNIPEDNIFKGFRKRNMNPSKSTIIPLKFNAKIDGIGGLVIGNVFKIDKKFLPKGYQEDDVAFVIMTESQSITAGQDWTTSFSGQLILLDSLGEGEHEDVLILSSKSTQPQTGLVSANKTTLISTEQQMLDPQNDTLQVGDNVYLKINNEPTNIRTGTEINNYSAKDNIIGTIPAGNAKSLLGTIAQIVNKDPEPQWIERIAGTNLTEEQKIILGYRKIIRNGIEYEGISVSAPVYDGAKSNSSGTISGQEGLAYFNKKWNWTNKVEEDGKDYYLLKYGEKYAFEQNISYKWFLISFNEDIQIDGQGIFSWDWFNDDKLINDSSIPVENGGWMRVDTIQASPGFSTSNVTANFD